jgi:hypothetical protein
MTNLQGTKLAFNKLGTMFLVVYVAIFYALPLGFFSFKPLQQLKSKPITDAGYEFSEGYDFENETQPGTSDTFFGTLHTTGAFIHTQSCALAQKRSHLTKREPVKIFGLNCSFIYYG